ncbi:MAG TPA: 6-phosphogluconolactonase, partial [Candidatus Sumerlaeota bacterium]|nr:6-phosphogluconolactonase [Candidatus Sumerlaeota bacterium]
GIATIREARSLLLLATGDKKAAALHRALDQPPTLDCPASLLQAHRDLTIICDEAAASQLRAR